MRVPSLSVRARNLRRNSPKLKPPSERRSRQPSPRWKVKSPIWKNNWRTRQKNVCCNRRPIANSTKRSRSCHLTSKMNVVTPINIKNKLKKYANLASSTQRSHINYLFRFHLGEYPHEESQAQRRRVGRRDAEGESSETKGSKGM